MKNNFAKKVISLSCAAILCVSCAISASASTKTSTTNKYSTKYGTFQGRLNCTRGTDKAAALASTDCYFKGYVAPYAPKLYAEVELQHWSSGNTIAIRKATNKNCTGVTTEPASGAASSYVTAWSSHVLYETDGSKLLKKGTQTIKV